MKNFTTLFSLLFLLILYSCSTEPEAIHYGSDQCHLCKMNIVDQQHAAQYVTKKGKQYKFDAIECMMNQLKEVDDNDIAKFLVSDYGNPGEMTDATKATYLISENIKSPMGAYLSAFSDKQKAIQTQKEFTGKLYDWNAIQIELAKK